MAKTLTLTAKASVAWDHENVDATVGNTSCVSSYSYSKSYTNGTAINNVDLIYVSNGTIAGAGNTTFDLAGALADFFGATITMARVKVMYIELTTDTTSTSVAVGNGTNPFINWVGSGAHTVNIRNGGCLFLSAPDATAYAVTATTGDILKILNNDGSNTATYKICIAGASA